MTLEQVCYVLFVYLKERYSYLAIRLEVFPGLKLGVNVINDSLNDAFVPTLVHHVSSNFSCAGLLL